MKTPDEARQCWCPFVRKLAVFDSNQGRRPGTFNRAAEDELVPSCNCIADECMAWRWGYVLEELTEIDETAAAFKAVPQFAVSKSGKTGYCGLAGKP